MASVILNRFQDRVSALKLDDEKVAKCFVIFVVVEVEVVDWPEIPVAIVH